MLGGVISEYHWAAWTAPRNYRSGDVTAFWSGTRPARRTAASTSRTGTSRPRSSPRRPTPMSGCGPSRSAPATTAASGTAPRQPHDSPKESGDRVDDVVPASGVWSIPPAVV